MNSLFLKNFLRVLGGTISLVFISNYSFALDIPIYIGDVDFSIDQNNLILDGDDSGGTIAIQFGGTLNGEYLQHDGTSFVFSDDVDFNGGQLLNFRIENLSSAPLCDGSS